MNRKVLGAIGATVILATVGYLALTKNQPHTPTLAELQIEATAAPPNWDYCTQPSYYIRACEASPYTRRWTGGDASTCPVTAICGAHTRSCNGDDGITYAMMDQGGARYYPKPQDSAGAIVVQKWIDCYVNKIDVFGNVYPCHAVTNAPGGRQAPSMLTLSQLPAGNPQIPSFCATYHCTLPICGTGPAPTMTATAPAATLTPVPTLAPVCPTCPPACKTSTPTKTFTPHIGPNITNTPCASAACK